MSTDEARFCLRCGTPLAERETGGRTYPACPAEGCGFVLWGNPTPVVAAIVEHDGEVILVRNHGWPEKWHGLVSGFLEREEAPAAGVLREVREELGLDGEVVSLVGVYAFEMRNEVVVAYHVRATGTVTLGPEIASFKRIPPDRLRPWPMGTGQAVADWLARR